MADAASKKREREQVLFELRAKRNQARVAHKEEVLAETVGEKLRRTEGHAEYVAQRAAAEAVAADKAAPGPAIDKEKERRLETSATEMDAIRKRKEKKAKNAGFQWIEHNSESKYKAYKKRVGTLDGIIDVRADYAKQKAAGKEMERDMDDMQYGEAPPVPEARMRAMVEELRVKADRKANFHRHKAEFEVRQSCHSMCVCVFV